MAAILEKAGLAPGRVLDVACGHGLYGIAVGRRFPRARIVFLDWPGVLRVAEENFRDSGLQGPFTALPGDALEADLGGPHDAVLLANFLHHFDPETCERFLRKVRASLAPGGCAVAVESIVEPDRISPPPAAWFSLVMLVTTPGGDVFSREELAEAFRRADFARSELHPLPRPPQQVMLAYRS
jgi:cyclopropane fatty-acyl-phospholipid synthase-like methyltransferase